MKHFPALLLTLAAACAGGQSTGPVSTAPQTTAPQIPAAQTTAPVPAAQIAAQIPPPAQTAPPPQIPSGAHTPLSRIKDVASLEGVRDNQLLGYGVVVGLAGTGDKKQSVFSAQSLTNILRRMGVTVDPTAIQIRNIAGVMVTANLPPFAQPGTKIDAIAAAIGDASNLQGGLLVMTSLKGADGQVYAVAQGPVVTGGFVAGRGGGGAGGSQTVNHPTVGRMPEGAIVEKAPPSVAPSAHLKLQLRQADFTTAIRLVNVVNKHFAPAGEPIAKAESSALIAVELPEERAEDPVAFVAEMEELVIDPDRREKIIINERTGTLVLGKDVHLSPVSILHGALNVEIQTVFNISQPGPLSAGKTALVPETTVRATNSPARNVQLQDGATVEDLVRALQAIGSTPRDIISILQAMRAAGALDAEIEAI